MEQIKRKNKQHLFLKLLFSVLIISGIIWYSGSFPVTMELLDKRINEIIKFSERDFEVSFFSDLSEFSDNIIEMAEYYFYLVKDNLSGSFSEIKKPGFAVITNAAKFPSEGKTITSGFGKREDPITGLPDDHSEGFFTKYCHLSKICITENNFINAGEKIGEAGNTGRSTGSHLHFEVMIDGLNIDPMECF